MNSPKWKYEGRDNVKDRLASREARAKEERKVEEMTPYADELTQAMQREKDQKQTLTRFKNNITTLKKDFKHSSLNSSALKDNKYQDLIAQTFHGKK
jgi:hypothetical protein